MEEVKSNFAEIEKWKKTPIKCLDNGFVRLADAMGGDYSVVQAARVSYGKGTKKISEDKGLIRYLMRHKHTSPFEMVEFKFHVRVPMDCWRQWIRHRTANVNEYSTRYSLAIDEKQGTSPENWRLQSPDNKQGSSGFLSAELGNKFSEKEKEFHKIASNLYQERIDAGIAKEQARKDLPLSTYTEAYWKIDLHNLLHFLKLRLDLHAQHEIRVYAEAIAQIVKDLCPLSYEAFEDYSLNAVTFSAPEIQWIKNKLEAVPLFVSEKEEMKNTIFDGNGRETEEFVKKLIKLNILTTP
ncbi:MAG: FAD-dependent thymidylate synthase [Patescibacteria group bacterium]